MRTAEWYVIQVETGREQAACGAIMRACRQLERKCALESDEDSRGGDEPLLRECFAPRYQTQYKLHGEYHMEERLLLPGYVVAVTKNPWKLARLLRSVPGFTKLLAMGETFAPLSKHDRSWMERWTTEGDRTIPMSVAYKKGDRIVVLDGPLRGFGGSISRIKRRLNEAEVVIHAGKNEGQIHIHTRVGLAVLPEVEAKQLVEL